MELAENSASVDTQYGYSALLLNSLKETSRLSFDVEATGEVASVGVAIHVDESFAVGYYIHIDFARRRMEFKSGVRMTERGGQMFPYEVELERPLSSKTTQSFSCRHYRIWLCSRGICRQQSGAWNTYV